MPITISVTWIFFGKPITITISATWNISGAYYYTSFPITIGITLFCNIPITDYYSLSKVYNKWNMTHHKERLKGNIHTHLISLHQSQIINIPNCSQFHNNKFKYQVSVCYTCCYSYPLLQVIFIFAITHDILAGYYYYSQNASLFFIVTISDG